MRKTACHVCSTQTIQRCSKCKQVFYCSAACQKQDWPAHKQICCKKIENTSEEVETYMNWLASRLDAIRNDAESGQVVDEKTGIRTQPPKFSSLLDTSSAPEQSFYASRNSPYPALLSKLLQLGTMFVDENAPQLKQQNMIKIIQRESIFEKQVLPLLTSEHVADLMDMVLDEQLWMSKKDDQHGSYWALRALSAPKLRMHVLMSFPKLFQVFNIDAEITDFLFEFKCMVQKIGPSVLPILQVFYTDKAQWQDARHRCAETIASVSSCFPCLRNRLLNHILTNDPHVWILLHKC